MKIDYDYIKDFFERAAESPAPDFDIQKQMSDLWLDTQDGKRVGNTEKLNKLIFHMEILEDQGLIRSSTDNHGLGFKRLSGGNYSVSVKALRITAAGHDFMAALGRQGVLDKLNTSFKDAGPGEAVKVAFALGAKALDKLLTEATTD